MGLSMRWMDLMLLAILSACSGDSAPEPTPDLPGLAFTFPPAAAATDQATLTVTGTTDRAVGGVVVNGVAAASDDGFRTWRADVPLDPGVTTLRAVADKGTTKRDITRTDVAMSRPSGLAYDAMTDTAWVVDQDGALIEIDLEAGKRRRVDASGVEFDRELFPGLPILTVTPPQDVAVDTDSRSAYVTSHNAVLRVDLDTGVRSFFATGNVPGRGVPPVGIQRGGSIYLDQTHQRLVVCDRDRRALLLIDHDTRVQTVVVAGGELTGLMRAMLYDAHRNVVYSFRDDVKRIDPETGDVVVVSAAGSGPDISPNAVGADVGPGAVSLYIADPDLRGIIEIDLIGGSRRELPGSGVAFVDPRDLVFDMQRNRLLVVDRGLDALIAVSLATGERTIVHGNGSALPDIADVHATPDGRLLVLHGNEIATMDGTSVASLAPGEWRRVVADGTGTLYLTRPGAVVAFDEPSGTARILTDHRDLVDPHALSLADGSLFALGSDLRSLDRAVTRIDPRDGLFVVIAGTDHGVPIPFMSPPRLAYDPVTDRLLSPRVIGSSGNLRADLLEIDPETGVNSTFTTFRSGDGPREQIALDTDGRRMFVASTRQLVILDLDTGNETRIAFTGVEPRDPAALAYRDGLLYLADRDWAAILALHPETGDCVFAKR